MEQSHTDQKKDELSSSKKKPSQSAVIYFPKPTKKNVGKGLRSIKAWLGRIKPILFAALISTIFATIAFSFIDPDVVSQPVLNNQPAAPGEEPAAAASTIEVAIPDQSMWVVQAGVFKEVGSAETSLREIAAEMPVIQTSHEDFYALWVGAAGDEASAKVVAEKHQTEAVPLYVKEVSRSGETVKLSESDGKWLQAAIATSQSLIADGGAAPISEDLIKTQPENETLHPLFKSMSELQKTPADAAAEKEKAALEVIKMLWELPQKNS